MIIFVNTSAQSPGAAIVADKPESAPSVAPDFVYGDKLGIDLYLVDGDGNFDPRSGDGANTIRAALGPIGGTIIAYQATWSAIANGFHGILDLNTTEADTLLGPAEQVTTTFEIEITEASTLKQTIVQTPVVLRREIIPTTPNAPTPIEDYTTTAILNKSFVQNRFSITGLTGGGGTNLDGIVTAAGAVETGSMVAVVISGTVYLYRLENSIDAENSPTRIRPDDFNNPANARVWHLTTTGQASTQAANLVLAGPTSGAAAIPTFRSLVADDLPAHAHDAGDVTSGAFTTPRLGSGTSTTATFLRGDAGGNPSWSDTLTGDLKFSAGGLGLSWDTGTEFVRRGAAANSLELGTDSTVRLLIGSNINFPTLSASILLRLDASKNIAAVTLGSGLSFDGTTLSATGSGGTVTSVGLSAPTQFSVSGSPVTGSGTLALSWANQSANLVLAGPASGGAAAPTFRAIVPDDLAGGGQTYNFLRGDGQWTNNFLKSTADNLGPSLGMVKTGKAGDAFAAPVSGAALGALHFYGYDGSSTSESASVRAVATENFSSGNVGSKLQFYTFENGGVGISTLRLTIDHDGKINVAGLTASKFVKTDASKNLVSADIASGDLPSHTHAAGDITSGVLSSARLGSGSASTLTFLRGDNSWQKIRRNLLGDTTQNANSGTSLTDLTSYTIVAQTLGTNGDAIHSRCTGTFAANGNTKDVEVSYGGSSIFTGFSAAYNGGYWVADIELVRINGTAIHCSVSFNARDGAGTTRFGSCVVGAVGVSQASDQILKCQGKGGASSDVDQESMTVTIDPV